MVFQSYALWPHMSVRENVRFGLSVRGGDRRQQHARVDDVLPAGVEALTGDQVAAEGTDAVRDAMGIFTTVLLVFAGVSVLVGCACAPHATLAASNRTCNRERRRIGRSMDPRDQPRLDGLTVMAGLAEQ